MQIKHVVEKHGLIDISARRDGFHYFASCHGLMFLDCPAVLGESSRVSVRAGNAYRVILLSADTANRLKDSELPIGCVFLK